MSKIMKALSHLVLGMASACAAACHSRASDCGPPPGAASSRDGDIS